MKHLKFSDILTINAETIPLNKLKQFLVDIEYYIQTAERKHSLTKEELKEMFEYYNLFYNQSEYSYHCGSCRHRVYLDLVAARSYVAAAIKKRQKK